MMGQPLAMRFRTGALNRFSPRRLAGAGGFQRKLAAMLGAIALAFGLIGTADIHGAAAAKWGAGYFPNYMVTTHEGKTVPFYDALIKGKNVIVNFIYTNCDDICPLQSARQAQLRKRLGDRVGRDIFMISITKDPERDTPEVLKAYAEAFGAGGGWLFITGKPDEMEKIRWTLGERSRELSAHRNDMMLGNDKTGDWSRSSVFQDYEVTLEDIHRLDPNNPNLKIAVAKASNQTNIERQVQVEHHVGEALFIKGCASCHTVGRGDHVGPDLKDVEKRRDHEWLRQFLLSPTKMREAKDPTTMALIEQFKGVRMPNLTLGDQDIADVLQYIRTVSEGIDDAKKAAGTKASEVNKEVPQTKRSGG